MHIRGQKEVIWNIFFRFLISGGAVKRRGARKIPSSQQACTCITINLNSVPFSLNQHTHGVTMDNSVVSQCTLITDRAAGSAPSCMYGTSNVAADRPGQAFIYSP